MAANVLLMLLPVPHGHHHALPQRLPLERRRTGHLHRPQRLLRRGLGVFLRENLLATLYRSGRLQWTSVLTAPVYRQTGSSNPLRLPSTAPGESQGIAASYAINLISLGMISSQASLVLASAPAHRLQPGSARPHWLQRHRRLDAVQARRRAPVHARRSSSSTGCCPTALCP